MLYMIYSEDIDNSLALRKETRPAHLARLEALKQQVARWSNKVTAVINREDWSKQQSRVGEPDVILADYHLDGDDNGVKFVNHLQQHYKTAIPSVICSADTSETIREKVSAAELSFIKKPVKALALRRLINQLLNSKSIV